MSHRDAEITEVTIILRKDFEERLQDAVQMLTTAGMMITQANDDNSVIEGAVESCRLLTIEHLECVQYVRKVMTYTADYPVGDPRDKDGASGECPDLQPPPAPRRYGKNYP